MLILFIDLAQVRNMLKLRGGGGGPALTHQQVLAQILIKMITEFWFSLIQKCPFVTFFYAKIY